MLKKLLREYIAENRKVVTLLFVCIITGILAGIVIYSVSGKEVKDILTSQMTEAIKVTDNGEFIKTEVIYNGVKNNIAYIFVMFVFSIMLYGTVFIYLLYVVKGLSIGIYVGTIFGIFGFFWGALVVLLMVVLINVVYLPALSFIGVTMINYNLNLMEYKREVRKVNTLSKVIVKTLFGLMIIFSSIIIEQLMSNIVIKIVSNMKK